MLIRYAKLHPDAQAPTYATDGSAAMDLYALIEDDHAMLVVEGAPRIIRTGLAVEIPAGHVLQIHSRSGHAFSHFVRLANCTGIIDSDYRGELKIALTADLGGQLTIRHGDRIAQCLLLPVPRMEWQEVDLDTLTPTTRGQGGFGHTGA